MYFRADPHRFREIPRHFKTYDESTRYPCVFKSKDPGSRRKFQSSQEVPRGPNRILKGSQDCPRMVPGGSKESRRVPGSATRSRRYQKNTRKVPEGSQDGPRTVPGRSQEGPRRVPGWPQDGPKRIPESSQESLRRIPRRPQNVQGFPRMVPGRFQWSPYAM